MDANYLRNTKGSPGVDTAAIAESHPEGDARDLERPRFHVMSRRGWTSDPCGPMYHDGRYLPPTKTLKDFQLCSRPQQVHTCCCCCIW